MSTMMDTDKKEFFVEFEKWAKVIENLCSGKPTVEQIRILRKAKPIFFDKITFFELKKSEFCIYLENEILETLTKKERKRVLKEVNNEVMKAPNSETMAKATTSSETMAKATTNSEAVKATTNSETSVMHPPLHSQSAEKECVRDHQTGSHQ